MHPRGIHEIILLKDDLAIRRRNILILVEHILF
jgi:hypothetical protein